MFNLTRYFAIASLFCIVVAAALLGMFYRKLSVDSLMAMAQDRNAALTDVFGKALLPHFAPLLNQPEGKYLRATDPAIATLRNAVSSLAKNTSAVKVKIYNLDGITVFSTEAKQIGEDKRYNAGFRKAATGRLASELTHRNKFSSFDRIIEQRDLLSTYIPFVGKTGKIEGVFELYSDVTPFLAHVKQTQTRVFVAVAGILSALYALLYLIVRRANGIIKGQEAELARTLAKIEEHNQLLDHRVNERTKELQELNLSLQGEILERRRAEEALQLSAKVFENTLEGVIVTDPSTKILAVNRAFTAVTGYEQAEVLHGTPQILHSGKQLPDFYANLWGKLNDTGQWVGEIWNRRKNGEIYPERLSISAIRDASGAVKNYVGVFSDISDIKQSQERLDYLAHHDLLTNLPNRLLFNHRLEHSIELARRNHQELAILFVDLDHFKHVNDTLGHEVGDELLRQVAENFTTHLRRSDTVARVGGDEFLLLLEDVTSPRYASVIAEKILEMLSSPFTVRGYELSISASVGIAFFPKDGEDVSTLVKNADTAMYHAKTHGRNAWHFYAPEMSNYARERVHLESLLRRSIDRNELILHYQPQIDLSTGTLVGAEALVRWQSSELGLVSPVRFIPIAEDIGFIGSLGEWVLRTACRQAVAWDAQGLHLPSIAVNLSMKQLERGNIIDIVTEILEETGLEPGRLELEVTESAVMQNDRALEYLEGLRGIGVKLAVDDFGTGYSSLSYLRRLPVQKLKIDRSFIANVSGEPGREAIVRAVLAMAEALGLRTTAEGIETEAEANFLKQEGCQQAQGYLFGRPIPADDLLKTWGDA